MKSIFKKAYNFFQSLQLITDLNLIVHAKSALQIIGGYNGKRNAIEHNSLVMPHYAAHLCSRAMSLFQAAWMAEERNTTMTISLVKNARKIAQLHIDT